MIIVWLPVLFALVGLVMYVLAHNPKAQEIGRIMFFAGVLAMMFIIAHKVVRLD